MNDIEAALRSAFDATMLSSRQTAVNALMAALGRAEIPVWLVAPRQQR
jgi:hypothetical protein